MKRIRVLHVITRLDRGGSAENTLLTVAGLEPRRYEVALAVGPTQGPASPTEAVARRRGVRWIEVPSLVRPLKPWADVAGVWALWRLMRRDRYHIVHTHTSKAGILGRLAAALAGVPLIVHTPHGHVFYGYYGRILTRLFVWLERLAGRWSDRIIGLTGADVQDHVDFGIARPDKFVAIHSGVDFGPLQGPPLDKAACRAALGLGDGPVVGTVGRLTGIKGQADLLQACALFKDRIAGLQVLLVGDGEERARLKDAAARLGVNAVFPGWRTDLKQVFGGMDVFAFSSHNEGMGKALVEAMYAGLPVVATGVGGVPELLEDGVDGVLVPPRRPELLAAALEALLADEARRRRLGTAARAKAGRYSAEAMVRQIDGLYGILLKEKDLV